MKYYPFIVVGAIIGVLTVVFILAYAFMKNKKEAIGFDRHMKDSEIIRRMGKYLKPYVWDFVLVIFIMLISIVYDVVSPLIVKNIEETIKHDFEMSTLIPKVILYASILIVSLVSTYFQAMLLQKTGQKMLSAMREEVFSHIESLSHNQLNHEPVGKLVTRVTNDTNSISMMFTNVIVNLAKNTFVVFAVLGAMLALNYMLTLMVLCFVPFLVLFTLIFRKFLRRSFRKVKDRTTDINTYLSENLSGMKITQIFNREERKMQEFSEKNDSLSLAKRHQIMVFGIFRPAVYMLYITSVMLLLFLGGKGVIEETEFLGQKITGGVIVAFYMYIQKFFNPIQNLAEQFNRMQAAFASAEKIFTILDMTPEVVDTEGAIELDEVRGEIEFKNVWFSYIEGEWVLKDVSFKVNAKETVAFVGSTGSGKTTILSLICRNYDIQKGEILIPTRVTQAGRILLTHCSKTQFPFILYFHSLWVLKKFSL